MENTQSKNKEICLQRLTGSRNQLLLILTGTLCIVLHFWILRQVLDTFRALMSYTYLSVSEIFTLLCEIEYLKSVKRFFLGFCVLSC